MQANDTDSDEDYGGRRAKKVKNEDSVQLVENTSSSHISFVNGSKKDDQNVDENSYDQYLKYEQCDSSDESSVFIENKYDDSESEDYVPISDSEFELEKFIIKNENRETKVNEKTVNEFVKNNECNDVDDGGDTNKETTTNKSGVADNEEVDDLLDEAFQDKNDDTNEDKNKGVTKDDFREYEKIVIEEVYKNHFDILPENWIEATHKSGMPVYLHKKTRVVSLSRPYFLGPGDAKSHLAPLSAISCLQYRKGIESKETLKNEPDFQVSKLGDMVIPNAKVETAQENIIKESLTHKEFREYCQSIFK